jgi:hypothetical protein
VVKLDDAVLVPDGLDPISLACNSCSFYEGELRF